MDPTQKWLGIGKDAIRSSGTKGRIYAPKHFLKCVLIIMISSLLPKQDSHFIMHEKEIIEADSMQSHLADDIIITMLLRDSVFIIQIIKFCE